MKTAFPRCHDQAEWKALYWAAILESDKHVIPERVSEAEAAVLARQRELFYGDGTPEEQEALEDALYALRAFRSALEHTEEEISRWVAKLAA